MKRMRSWLALVAAVSVTGGCNCAPTNLNNDGGTGGGSGGGLAAGGGGGAGGGAAGGGAGGGLTGGGGGATGGSGGGTTGGGAGGGMASTVRPAKDIISGSGRVTGGSFVMDAQIGQGMPQAPTTGGGRVLQGNTAIKR